MGGCNFLAVGMASEGAGGGERMVGCFLNICYGYDFSEERDSKEDSEF